MFVTLCSHKTPFLADHPLPPDSLCLVFDHTPAGYRRACIWITKNIDKREVQEGRLYRLHVPCLRAPASPSGGSEAGAALVDLEDYELAAQRAEGRGVPSFTGALEAWPEGQIFPIERIDVLPELVRELDALPTFREKLDRVVRVRQSRAEAGGESRARRDASKRARAVEGAEGESEDESGDLGGNAERDAGAELLWPRLASRGSFDDLWAAGYLSEYALCVPDVYTGLSAIQTYVLKAMQRDPAMSVRELVYSAHARFQVDRDIVWRSVQRLCVGNDPWLDGVPQRDGIPVARAARAVNAYQGFEHPVLPPWMLNGSYPVSPRALCDYFCDWVVRGVPLPREGARERLRAPSCAPHLIERYDLAQKARGLPCEANESTSRYASIPAVPTKDHSVRLKERVIRSGAVSSAVGAVTRARWAEAQPIVMPYMVSDKEVDRAFRKRTDGLAFVSNQRIIPQVYVFPTYKVDEQSDERAFWEEGVTLELVLDFWDPVRRECVRFASLDDYLRAWVSRKFRDLLELRKELVFRRQRSLNERAFMRTLWVQEKYEDENGMSRRVFIDEPAFSRIARLRDRYGEEHVQALLNTPISQLGKYVVWDDDDLVAPTENDIENAPPERYKFVGVDPAECARGMWANQLRIVQGAIEERNGRVG